MAIASALRTLEEFHKLPEQEPELEYLHGTVSQKVSHKGRHANLQAELLDQIRTCGLPSKLAE